MSIPLKEGERQLGNLKPWRKKNDGIERDREIA
jgi:hypothetical protein